MSLQDSIDKLEEALKTSEANLQLAALKVMITRKWLKSTYP